MSRRASANGFATVVFFVGLAAALTATAGEFRVPRQPGLTPAAEEIVAGFESEAGVILAESLARTTALRTRTVARLQALLAARMQAADLDGALSIREQIRALEGSPDAAKVTGDLTVLRKTIAAPSRPPVHSVDPGDLGNFYNRVGESFLFEVTGNVDGMVWGTDCYTYDSDLSTAAVHAGVVGLGVRRLVRVTVEKGPARFIGSNRNDVVSYDWDNSGGHYTAYRIEALPSPEPLPPVPLPDPGNLLAFRGLNGRQFYFRVTGRAGVDRTVWGTDVYTDDSYLAIAAVHAGALQVGQAGIVRVTILPGLASYQGSQRNGVRSEDYPAYDGSYRIERYQAEPGDDASIRLKATEMTITGTNTLVIED